MFDDPDSILGSLDNDEAFGMLQELEANTTDDLRRQRSHFRLSIKASVVLQAGNASELLRFKVKGVTGDISEGGLSAVFPIPVRVGDIYRLQFDRQTLDLPLTFARAVRCRLIREDAFETGFSFFSAISLPQNLEADAGSTLVS